jgi:hypothetical protein
VDIGVKLGKKKAKHDPRTLMLAKYITKLPPPLVSVDWTKKVSNLGMMLNDNLGDCTCADCGHMIQTWTANSGTQVIPPDSQVLNAYEVSCGYDPSDPSTDQGGVELDVLTNWQQGQIFSDHPIMAFVAIQTQSASEIKDCVSLFGGCYIGIQLPITAQDQTVWSVVPGAGSDGAPGSWGGHAVPIVAYDSRMVTVVTWGSLLQATWEFMSTYLDEGYGVLSKDWLTRSGIAPSGFDLTQLQIDLQAVQTA